MLRVLLSLALAACIGTMAYGADRAKKAPKTPDEQFKALDTDGDGKLTLDEFTAKCKTDKQKEEATKKFKKADTENHGFLSLEEFKKMIEKKPGKKKEKTQ